MRQLLRRFLIWLEWSNHDYVYFADRDREEAGFKPLVLTPRKPTP